MNNYWSSLPPAHMLPRQPFELLRSREGLRPLCYDWSYNSRAAANCSRIIRLTQDVTASPVGSITLRSIVSCSASSVIVGSTRAARRRRKMLRSVAVLLPLLFCTVIQLHELFLRLHLSPLLSSDPAGRWAGVVGLDFNAAFFGEIGERLRVAFFPDWIAVGIGHAELAELWVFQRVKINAGTCAETTSDMAHVRDAAAAGFRANPSAVKGFDFDIVNSGHFYSPSPSDREPVAFW